MSAEQPTINEAEHVTTEQATSHEQSRPIEQTTNAQDTATIQASLSPATPVISPVATQTTSPPPSEYEGYGHGAQICLTISAGLLSPILFEFNTSLFFSLALMHR